MGEEKVVSEARQDVDKKLFGLQIARSLNFTDPQYEEAISRIDTFDNMNQLLVALLDVSSVKPALDNKKGNMYSKNNRSEVENCEKIDIVSTCERNTSSNDLDSKECRARPIVVKATSSCDSTKSLSSASFLSNTSGLASAEDQSLECLTAVQHNNNYQYHQPQTQPSRHVNHECKKKLQRSRSHQPTTSATSPSSTDLKTIYIDGPNVARTHGKDVTFSWQGIKICVDWFRRRQHKVRVFVPVEKCDSHGSPAIAGIVNYLTQIEALIKTPSGCSDDMFIIEAARQSNGIIVSNDLYRNEKRSNTDLKRHVSLNRLPYIFVDDLFIPANDPLGRTGPSLDEFLRFENNSNQAASSQKIHKQSLHRTRSHQRQWQ